MNMYFNEHSALSTTAVPNYQDDDSKGETATYVNVSLNTSQVAASDNGYSI